MDPAPLFAALADPTRREIYEIVAGRPISVGELAAKLPVTRPAVSQHLRVLADAGLVRATARGTRRIYSVDPAGLESLRSWIEGMWDGVLDSFEAAARKEAET